MKNTQLNPHHSHGLFHLAARVRYPDGAGPAAGDRQVPEPAFGWRKTSSRQLAAALDPHRPCEHSESSCRSHERVTPWVLRSSDVRAASLVHASGDTFFFDSGRSYATCRSAPRSYVRPTVASGGAAATAAILITRARRCRSPSSTSSK